MSVVGVWRFVSPTYVSPGASTDAAVASVGHAACPLASVTTETSPPVVLKTMVSPAIGPFAPLNTTYVAVVSPGPCSRLHGPAFATASTARSYTFCVVLFSASVSVPVYQDSWMSIGFGPQNPTRGDESVCNEGVRPFQFNGSLYGAATLENTVVPCTGSECQAHTSACTATRVSRL